MPGILIVEPSRAIRSRLGAWLENTVPDHRMLLAGDGGEALRLADTGQPAVILVEMRLPDRSGFDLVRRLRRRLPDARIFATNFHDNRSFRDDALAAGADDFIPKHRLYTDLIPLIESLEEKEGSSRESGVN